uniref:Tyrosine-protein phosphatase domain-containing protein n=3 Tax=Octopus bimaculoides TaxID=37653 RepID=A0A0L8H487_OCTBM
MINERFQKYTEASPMRLLSQTVKNILQYLDEIEKTERETQADIKSKQSTGKHFSDSQPLQECGIPYRPPPKYPFPKTKSKDTDIDYTKPITPGQILKRIQDIQIRDKSTEAVSPAKSEKSKESKVSETPMLPSREYARLEPAKSEPVHQSLSKAELLALDESSKGAKHKHSKKPFIMVASNALKEIRSRDKYENLQRKLNEGQVFAEFRSTGVKSQQMPCSVGYHFENAIRNRYQSVVPYDENRVQLTGRLENVFGYINASSIKWRRGPHELSFIAAQAPLKNNLEDFWQMVWEQKVSIIIMLNSIDNESKLGCCLYWPQEWNLDQKFQSGPFTVTFHTYRRTPEYYLDVLTITDPSGEQQLISNLHFTQWSQDDCPCDLSIFVSFLEEIESVQNLMRTKHPVQAPIAVLCHDGVGRTGVLIMSYIMKYCLKCDLEMNLQNLLGFLRSNRMLMVTSLKQYISVYEALIYFLKGQFSPPKTYLVGPFKI